MVLAGLLLLGALLLPAPVAWGAGLVGVALVVLAAWSHLAGGERWIVEEPQPGHLVLKQEGAVGGTTRYLYAQTTQRLELRHAWREFRGNRFEVLQLWFYTDDREPSHLLETPCVGGRVPVRAIAELLAARLGRPLHDPER